MKVTMVGRLGECLLLSYRTPAQSVVHLLPPQIKLLTRGEWAFWNILVCRLEEMRPYGFPKWSGFGYHHVAYRLYVAATGANEKVEGIHFLRSDVDHFLLSSFGNFITDFRLHPARINLSLQNNGVLLSVKSRDDLGNAEAGFDFTEQATLPEDSCFNSMEEARKFLKYRPTGLACDPQGRVLRLAEVFRDETKWKETPVHVSQAKWAFLEHLNQQNAILELATRVVPLDYQWRLGRCIPLKETAA